MSAALFAMAMQLMPAPGLPRWRVVINDAVGEYAVDPQSVVRQGARVRAAVRMRPRRSAQGGVFGVVRYVYDCRANTVRSEASDFYNGQGRFVGTLQSRPDELRDRPIGPGSPNARLRAFLCAPQRR
jgi:hypothetical protein